MPTTYYANRRGGHCPGHIRDAFLGALDAYRDWDGFGAEPDIIVELGNEPQPVPISTVAKAVWNCSDILPGAAIDVLEDAGLIGAMSRRTYASAARALASACATSCRRGSAST